MRFSEPASIKTSIFLFFLLSYFAGNAQLQRDESGDVQYSEVVKLPGLSQKEINDKARSWIVTTLKSADNMTELDDENYQQVVGTGNLIIDPIQLPYWPKSFTTNTYLNFKFQVQSKDGRLRYSIENFLFTYQDGLVQFETTLNKIDERRGWTKKMRAKFKESAEETIDAALKKLASDFKATLQEEEDDW